MSNEEQDNVVLAQLEIMKEAKELVNVYKERQHNRGEDKDTRRCNNVYKFCNVDICQMMYLFIHPMGYSRFKSLQNHFMAEGIAPRRHGLSGKPGYRANAIGPDVTEAVVTFIKKYAEKFAIPPPGRMPRFKDWKVMKLPSHETKMSVYQKYIEAVGDNEKLKIGDRSFCNMWNLYVPHITTMRPAYDLCDSCKQNTMTIYQSMNNQSEEKIKKLNEALEHLNGANRQRQYYQAWCKCTGMFMINDTVFYNLLLTV
jgi:hypothetical protein